MLEELFGKWLSARLWELGPRILCEARPGSWASLVHAWTNSYLVLAAPVTKCHVQNIVPRMCVYVCV